MTSEPHAFLTIDHGAATASIALIGRVAGTWRLIGTLALPAGAAVDVAVDLLVSRVRIADPELASTLGIVEIDSDALPRFEVRSRRPRRLAVVGGRGADPGEADGDRRPEVAGARPEPAPRRPTRS